MDLCNGNNCLNLHVYMGVRGEVRYLNGKINICQLIREFERRLEVTNEGDVHWKIVSRL